MFLVCLMHYFVYLDEFGHIGPYVSPTDSKYNTSPIFGLGGLILPANRVRHFSSFFYQLKNQLCRYELEKSGHPPYRWECKGSSIFRPKNVEKYLELRTSTNRLLNKINQFGGHVFYVGLAKYKTPEESNAEKLYLSVLQEAIKRVNQFAEIHDATVSIILDQISEMGSTNNLRTAVVGKACQEMFGCNHRTHLVEPPLQVESHLYQTVQCADWICSLVGKLETFKVMPTSYPTYEVFKKYFDERIRKASKFSSVRQSKPK